MSCFPQLNVELMISDDVRAHQFSILTIGIENGEDSRLLVYNPDDYVGKSMSHKFILQMSVFAPRESDRFPPWVWCPLRRSPTPGWGQWSQQPSGQTARRNLPVLRYSLEEDLQPRLCWRHQWDVQADVRLYLLILHPLDFLPNLIHSHYFFPPN